MVNNRLVRPVEVVVPGPTDGQTKELALPPREAQDKWQHKTHVSLNSRTDRKFVAMSKRGRLPERTKPGVDICEALNAKRNQDGDLRAKINGQRAVAVSKIPLAGLVV